MAEHTRARGIRDIAHLYLSKKSGSSAQRGIDLWVCAENRACLPGYHVANIAAAIASRDVRVHVLEVSGLLPNAAVFFGLPPAAYLGDERGPVAGLNAVTVAFDAADLPSEPGTTVNIIHLPPLEYEDQLAAAAGTLDGATREWNRQRLALMLHRKPQLRGTDAVAPWIDEHAIYRLGLVNLPVTEYARGRLGALGGWERGVSDRTPCVARDPSSRQAKAYLSVVDSLLSRARSHRHPTRTPDVRSNGPGGRERRVRATRYAESETPR